MPEPVDLFFSYSHKDEPLRDELAAHLAVLRRTGVLREWHDRRIGAGEDWRGAIDDRLASAGVILLLVSADFLASDYCYDVEMARAMERRDRGEAHVIPVILRACDWSGAPFSKIQALPKDARPATSWPNRDEAWHDVARGIRAAAEHIAARAGGLPARPSHRPAPAPIEYDVIRPIARGLYGSVIKCRRRDTGEVCIVKRTREDAVSVAALEALTSFRCENIASPRRVFREDGHVCEELPYIGGTRLSDAVLRPVGGLRGAMLVAFLSQMRAVVQEIHAAGLIHRDVHPENVYLVVEPFDRSLLQGGAPTRGARHVHADVMGVPPLPEYRGLSLRATEYPPFSVRFVLVDNTFAITSSEARKAPPVRHGSYTPEEQAIGRPGAASDLYALGATAFFGLTGCDPPAPRQGGFTPSLLDGIFTGHGARNFDDIMARLLDSDPSRRIFLGEEISTMARHDCGMLALDGGQFLSCNTFDLDTRIVDRAEAVALQREAEADVRGMLDGASPSGPQYKRLKHAFDEATGWVNRLSARPPGG